MAQLYPQAYLFGLGQLLPILSQHLSDLFDMDIDIGAFVLQGMEFSADEYLLAETFITASGCTGAILICLSLFNRHAPKFPLGMLLLSMTLIAKTLASALLFKPEYAYAADARRDRWFADQRHHVVRFFICACAGAKATGIFTAADFARGAESVTGQSLLRRDDANLGAGKILNFNGAAQFLSLCWPWMALWTLLRKPKPAAAQVAVS
jgi:hypothetical protein